MTSSAAPGSWCPRSTASVAQEGAIEIGSVFARRNASRIASRFTQIESWPRNDRSRRTASPAGAEPLDDLVWSGVSGSISGIGRQSHSAPLPPDVDQARQQDRDEDAHLDQSKIASCLKTTARGR